jgi:hypothetical protein
LPSLNHFAHAVADRRDVAGVAVDQALDSRHDLRPAANIAQILQPG